MRLRSTAILTLLLVASLPVFAGDRVIQSGIDPWITHGDGRTFINFAALPIPAGFFCPRSEAFTEQVAFKGIPVATAEPGVLGATDTIVHRLDDAVFNKDGIATTRIQVRALQFESIQPIKTACGLYKAEVRLNGEQPITTMRIVRQSADGGRFFAPIAVNGKVVFTPIGRRSTGGEVLELPRNVRFPANQGIQWSDRVGPLAAQKLAFVNVDTDSDGVADTYLPGTSNFAAGWPVRVTRQLLNQDSAKVQFQVDCHVAWGPEAVEEGHCPAAAW